ncbi:hypothetical protein H0O02_03435 [Candidatus Micrarchaeota archaeon]|nr:hypothetical protein [Candidatus Micrarchaeota archaeon]
MERSEVEVLISMTRYRVRGNRASKNGNRQTNEERFRKEFEKAHEGPEVIRVIHSAKSKPPQLSRDEIISNIKRTLESGARESLTQEMTKAALGIASVDQDPAIRRYAAKALKILNSGN